MHPRKEMGQKKDNPDSYKRYVQFFDLFGILSHTKSPRSFSPTSGAHFILESFQRFLIIRVRAPF